MLVTVVFGLLCLPAAAQQEQKVYEHTGIEEYVSRAAGSDSERQQDKIYELNLKLIKGDASLTYKGRNRGGVDEVNRKLADEYVKNATAEVGRARKILDAVRASADPEHYVSPERPDPELHTVRTANGVASCFLSGGDADCYDHAVLGFTIITFDDSVRHILLIPVVGRGDPLGELLIDDGRPDKHFHYRVQPNVNIYGRTRTLLCTPERDKQGRETSKEVCYLYE